MTTPRAGLTSGELDEAGRAQLLTLVAARVTNLGMAVPAIFFLESCKPLSYVGSQVMVFFAPFVQAIFPINRYNDFAALMEDRRNVERLLCEIERLEEERGRREDEEKARRKAAARAARMTAGSQGKRGFFARMRGRLGRGGGAGARVVALAIAAGLALAGAGSAQSPIAPVTRVETVDTPNDAGRSIDVTWWRSPDDLHGGGRVSVYRIYRGLSRGGPWETVGQTNAGALAAEDVVTYTDATAQNGVDYWYRVAASDGVMEVVTDAVAPARASGQWFNTGRVNMLVAIGLIGGAILYFIRKASRGGEVYLRPVAGLKAFEEGVGRATELGRKVLFVPGVQDMDQVETVAGVNILGYVARMTARYETPLEVPVSRSLVMATAREICREAYSASGRPDLYNEEMIHYLTDEQFAYAAAVDGIILREKPATIFYQGKFYAESLILAETGNSIGAIQVAGTASPAQLPFFVTACDFTLIGEELFAASAYLSKEPKLMGSIKGQDFGKVLFMASIAVGVVIETLRAVGMLGFSIAPWFVVR